MSCHKMFHGKFESRVLYVPIGALEARKMSLCDPKQRNHHAEPLQLVAQLQAKVDHPSIGNHCNRYKTNSFDCP